MNAAPRARRSNPEWHPGRLEQAVQALQALREHLLRREEECAPRLAQVHKAYEDSARNLVHYLALREHDVRELQRELAQLGLSSLGRSESHVLGNLDAVLRAAGALDGRRVPPRPTFRRTLSSEDGGALLRTHTEGLLGAAPAGRSTRIMVTMPAAAAGDPALVRELIDRGMDCARINCAHDGPVQWAAMVDHVRRVGRAAGRRCHVLMDLAGPKLRTGPLMPGPRAVKLRPQRDALGRVAAPGRVWLARREAPEEPGEPADAVLPVPGVWLDRLRRGDAVSFTDLRGKRRQVRVGGGGVGGWWAETRDTAYVGTGTRLRIRRPGGRVGDPAWIAEIGELPAVERPLVLHRGETLLLTADPAPLPAVDGDEIVPATPTISCTLPEVLADVRVGDRVWFDDGKLGGVVRKADPAAVRVEITWARPQGSRLGSDKGINLPDTPLRVAGLTEEDVSQLPFVVQHADLVAMSFVRHPRDVQQLQGQLERCGGRHLGVVLKIETQQAFDHLPLLLLQAMRSHPVGVMIARGDLAVECGFERLAELQEEMLWICEAAHVPVIWATQVLENLAKTGLPSRAEITDAAMGERAECVMLNKGPYVGEAVRLLDDILRRMEGHQAKKAALLRPLAVAPAATRGAAR
ncbi:MAG: pyruvate kinase [Deltaproteobacteria bacterium]|nr:pyruvate kinase [Deltaproteobacteria bacterium]